MRIRHALTVLVLAAAGTLPLAGAAHAQPDRDCADFASQAEAQEALDNAPGDPERLDEDNDGDACDSYFKEAAARTTTTAAPTSAPEEQDEEEADEGQVRVLPQGGVDTGDGSTEQPATATTLIALAGVGLLAAGVRRQRHNAG